jgi:hypothetical protein
MLLAISLLSRVLSLANALWQQGNRVADRARGDIDAAHALLVVGQTHLGDDWLQRVGWRGWCAKPGRVWGPLLPLIDVWDVWSLTFMATRRVLFVLSIGKGASCRPLVVLWGGNIRKGYCCGYLVVVWDACLMKLILTLRVPFVLKYVGKRSPMKPRFVDHTLTWGSHLVVEITW